MLCGMLWSFTLSHYIAWIYQVSSRPTEKISASGWLVCSCLACAFLLQTLNWLLDLIRIRGRVRFYLSLDQFAISCSTVFWPQFSKATLITYSNQHSISILFGSLHSSASLKLTSSKQSTNTSTTNTVHLLNKKENSVKILFGRKNEENIKSWFNKSRLKQLRIWCSKKLKGSKMNEHLIYWRTHNSLGAWWKLMVEGREAFIHTHLCH